MAILHIVIVEERPLLRAAWAALIKAIPDLWVAEVHDSMDFFLSRRERYPADVILVGCPDEDDHGSVAAKAISRWLTGVPIVLISSAERHRAPETLPSMVMGIVCHHSTAEEMARVIRAAAERRSSLLPIPTTLHHTAPMRT